MTHSKINPVLKNLLDLWKGNEEGQYSKENIWHPSELQKAKTAIEAIEKKFANHQTLVSNSGRKKPSRNAYWNLQEKMHKAEARLDVTKAEVKYIRR